MAQLEGLELLGKQEPPSEKRKDTAPPSTSAVKGQLDSLEILPPEMSQQILSEKPRKVDQDIEPLSDKIRTTLSSVIEGAKNIVEMVPKPSEFIETAKVTGLGFKPDVDPLRLAGTTGPAIQRFVSGMTLGLSERARKNPLIGAFHPPSIFLNVLSPENLPEPMRPTERQTQIVGGAAEMAGMMAPFAASAKVAALIPGLGKKAVASATGKIATDIVKEPLMRFLTREAVTGSLLSMAEQSVSEDSVKAKNVASNALLFSGLGMMGRIATSRPIVALAKAAYEKIPPLLKQYFFYRGTQPQDFIKIAEDRINELSNAMDRATEAGILLSKDLTLAEQRRVGQIIRGGVSLSDRESKLRSIVRPIREELDYWEARLIEHGFLEPSSLGRLTRGQLATLRNTKSLLEKKIKNLSTFGAFRQKESLLDKATSVSLKGIPKVEGQIARAESRQVKLADLIEEVKDILPAEEFHALENILSKDQVKRSKSVIRLIERFEKSDIGKKEVMLGRIASVADRLGVDISKINLSDISIRGVRQLTDAISKVSGRFQGQTAIMRALQNKVDEIQKRIVDRYVLSGQSYMPRMYRIFEEPKKYGIPNALLPTLAEMSEGQLDALATLNPDLAQRIMAYAEKGKNPFFGRASKRIKIGGERFRKRVADDVVYRQALGEIHEPAYPVAKGLFQIRRDIANAKLFEAVASHSEWSSAEAIPGFIRMPADKRKYGPLADKYVIKPIADDIQGLYKNTSEWMKILKRTQSAWKFGKVILNPATHFRNMISNAILLDMSGVDLWRQPALLARSLNEMNTMGKHFRDAHRLGLLGHEFFGGELNQLIRAFPLRSKDGIETAMELSARQFDKAGKIYQSEEQVFKLAKYLDELDHGLSPGEAVKSAEKWMFNYGKVSRFIDDVRNLPIGIPFITFTAKAFPRVVESLVIEPSRILKYHHFLNAIENKAVSDLRLSEKDYHTIKSSMNGIQTILPVKDEHGDVMTLDVSYILPWGDVAETGGFGPLPGGLVPGGPILPFVETMMNRSNFRAKFGDRTGKIYLKTDTWDQVLSKSVKYIITAELPPIAGGVGSQQIISAMKGEKSKATGNEYDMATALLANVFGIKLRPQNLDFLSKMKILDFSRDVTELKSGIRNIERDPNANDDERRQKRLKEIQKIRARAVQFYNDMGMSEEDE